MYHNLGIWLSLLISLVTLAVLFYKRAFGYWKKKNVPFLRPTIPFGNIENPLFAKKGQNVICQELYDKFKKDGLQFGGIFLASTPVLIPVDPELIKYILVRDFGNFTSHGIHIDEKVDPLFNHLFAMNEPQWKPTRIKLTPYFSSGKMKIMFETMLNVGKMLKEHVDETINEKKALDVKEAASSFTIDVIGSCVFGVECNSLKNPDAEFKRIGKKITSPSALFILRRFFINSIPFIKAPIYSTDITTFFMNTLRSVINHRKANNYKRGDFIQILLDMRQKARDEGLEDPFSFKEMAAQAFVFFLAGFETSSTTMTFCLHEISHNQAIQDKLRNEINHILKKYEGKLTYEGLREMKYMSQVIDETLRKYPPLSIIPRECTSNYQIPGHPVTIEKGTHIWISTLGLHRDPEYYPEPEKFDPERFNDENRTIRHPSTFIPFGEGPRACIGLRFGLMQIKIGLTMLLSNYKFFPTKSHGYKVYFKANTVFTSPKDEILLKAERI